MLRLFRASCPSPLRGQPSAVRNRSRRFRQCATKTLDQCHGTGLCSRVAQPVFPDEMCGDRPVDDPEHCSDLGRLARQQKPQGERHAQHPLAQRRSGAAANDLVQEGSFRTVALVYCSVIIDTFQVPKNDDACSGEVARQPILPLPPGDDCMDAGGRATQGAVAEGWGEGVYNPSSCPSP